MLKCLAVLPGFASNCVWAIKSWWSIILILILILHLIVYCLVTVYNNNPIINCVFHIHYFMCAFTFNVVECWQNYHKVIGASLNFFVQYTLSFNILFRCCKQSGKLHPSMKNNKKEPFRIFIWVLFEFCGLKLGCCSSTSLCRTLAQITHQLLSGWPSCTY